MKQTIIHITLPDRFPTGGPRTLFDLVSTLDKNKFHSIVIYPAGRFSDQLANYCQVSNHTIKKYPNFTNLKHILKLIKQNPKSIIHFHHSNTLWLALFIKLFRKNKIIYTEHVLTKDYKPPNKLSYFIYKIQYYIYIRFVNQIISVSNVVKEFLINHFHIKANKIKVIPNGIVLPNKIPQQSKNHNFHITSVGAINWVKNYDDLISIMNILVNQYSLTQVKLTIIGDGPLRNQVEELINKYNLKENIILTGHLTLNGIYETLKQTDLYIQTSLSESFGLGILDAMSYGVPVVAYDVGAINEIVNKNCGILIPFCKDRTKRIGKFADQIKSLFEDNKLRKALSNGAILQSKNYSIEKMIEKYMILVNNLTSEQTNERY